MSEEENSDKLQTTDDGQPMNVGSSEKYDLPPGQAGSTAEPFPKAEQTSDILHHKSEIKNMETHAQHLHKAPGHGWKHFFFEFFMLFLAVTLGFFVENMRENYVERKRGKEYIRSLYEDLKTDTTRIVSIVKYDEDKLASLNGMTECYDMVSKNLKATNCMGVLVKYSKSNRSFEMNDRTLRQLANAGGFRLLPKEDADSILGYESAYKQYENFQGTLFQEIQNNVRNTLNLLADFKVNASLQTPAPMKGTISQSDTTPNIPSGPLLFSEDRALLNKWFNELILYLRATKGQRNLLFALKTKATGLIEYYKNKYQLGE